MEKIEIEQKLDMLAEFYSQRDALELRKRELLEEVKVPAEIQQIVADGMKRIDEAEKDIRADWKVFPLDERLAAIVVPQEYKDALEALDRQRAEIMAKMQEVEAQKSAVMREKAEYDGTIMLKVNSRKQEIRNEIETKTRQVYEDIERRKQEIEAEFSGKADHASQNIAKLEAEIKADMKRHAAERLEADPKAKDLSIKGQHFHAVYVRGRVTWNTEKMDAWVHDHPFLKEARKEGEPSITLRKV